MSQGSCLLTRIKGACLPNVTVEGDSLRLVMRVQPSPYAECRDCDSHKVLVEMNTM